MGIRALTTGLGLAGLVSLSGCAFRRKLHTGVNRFDFVPSSLVTCGEPDRRLLLLTWSKIKARVEWTSSGFQSDVLDAKRPIRTDTEAQMLKLAFQSSSNFKLMSESLYCKLQAPFILCVV